MKDRRERREHVNLWMSIGALLLVILLLIWLTVADFSGNTDVAMISSISGYCR